MHLSGKAKGMHGHATRGTVVHPSRRQRAILGGVFAVPKAGQLTGCPICYNQHWDETFVREWNIKGDILSS